MWKNYAVSVYYSVNPDWEKIEDYINTASKYGCREIFTSAHIPEDRFEAQISFIEKLSKLIHDRCLELTVDFGGKSLFRLFSEIGNYPSLSIDNIRLDCGYSPDVMNLISENLSIKSFVLNASTFGQEVLDEYYSISSEKGYKLKACHNFYPREESGLDIDFVLAQNRMFHEKNINVVTCVANHSNPRGPVFKGLPSIESQRNNSFEKSLLECMQDGVADEILIGDEWISKEDFKTLVNIKYDKILKLSVNFIEGLSEKEQKIVTGIHTFRYDSNSYILRSETSRTMAEYAQSIDVFNNSERKRGCITIDNVLYGRYSGEMQIILKALSADERVNVAGIISENDMYKLDYFRYGFKYDLEAI